MNVSSELRIEYNDNMVEDNHIDLDGMGNPFIKKYFSESEDPLTVLFTEEEVAEIKNEMSRIEICKQPTNSDVITHIRDIVTHWISVR